MNEPSNAVHTEATAGLFSDAYVILRVCHWPLIILPKHLSCSVRWCSSFCCTAISPDFTRKCWIVTTSTSGIGQGH